MFCDVAAITSENGSMAWAAKGIGLTAIVAAITTWRFMVGCLAPNLLSPCRSQTKSVAHWRPAAIIGARLAGIAPKQETLDSIPCHDAHGAMH